MKNIFATTLLLGFIAAAILTFKTYQGLKPAPKSFHEVLSDSQNLQILDRSGQPLNVTYQNNWNIHHNLQLHQFPDFLKKAFIISEDKRFYQHLGADWRARISALFTNIKAMRAVRGASTITEQSVRMIHPRPRTIWSRWLEGFEAASLEKHFSKDEILQFYLNQIPYAANRRGVLQASRYYFNRDLDTLSKKEMLALIVLVRAPSRLDLWKDTKKIEGSIARLIEQLIAKNIISKTEKKIILAQSFKLDKPTLDINANDFVSHVKTHPFIEHAGWPNVRTTLNSNLQANIQKMLDSRLKYLAPKKVNNGAVLAVDHQTGEVLAWVVAGKENDTPARFIDAVTSPRQPGSALKPLLYLLALKKGWSAATIIDDAPLIESVGSGLHSYQNYSRQFYGEVTLRQALGNSLNIPALKTLQYVGAAEYLEFLNNAGFKRLDKHVNFYGDGIALGNGEVTLYELVQAYSAIANRGVFKPLTIFLEGMENEPQRYISSPQAASLLANILSDPKARQMEFGEHSVLNFPVQTAVKTGTSNDYRDSWAVGFNYRYTAGVWMGNLDQRPTEGVTGSIGPALLLRSVFSEMTKHEDTRPLPIDRELRKYDLCQDTNQIKQTDENCETYTEWFIKGTEPKIKLRHAKKESIKLRQPVNGLHIAYNPRMPKDVQAFEFFIGGIDEDKKVEWDINGEVVKTNGGKYLWQLEKGQHSLSAVVFDGKTKIATIPRTEFLVK